MSTSRDREEMLMLLSLRSRWLQLALHLLVNLMLLLLAVVVVIRGVETHLGFDLIPQLGLLEEGTQVVESMLVRLQHLDLVLEIRDRLPQGFVF